VPVVPAAVVGTYAVWPTGSKPRWQGGSVSIQFGPQIAPPEPTPASRRRFNRHLQEVLAELSGADAADEFAPVGGPEGTDPGPDRP
jgi:1-acyl-sn-glycerol-3-phosphate acyltransferase